MALMKPAKKVAIANTNPIEANIVIIIGNLNIMVQRSLRYSSIVFASLIIFPMLNNDSSAKENNLLMWTYF